MFSRFRDPAAHGETDAATFVDGFRRRLDRLADSQECGATLCHVTTLLDTQEHQQAFREIVKLTVNDDRLWHPTCSEAADWMLGHPKTIPELQKDPFKYWDPRNFWKDATVSSSTSQ